MRLTAVRLPSSVVATALLVSACGASSAVVGSQGPPVVVREARDARAAVRDGRVVRPLVFDGGALRIDPATGQPRVSEADAIALVRAASPPGSAIVVTEVVVAFGTVTLATPVTTAGETVVPSQLPAFRGRPGWLVVYENVAHSCPAMPAPAVPRTPLREPLPVRLVAADGSGEGVTYAGAGAFCGGSPTVPSAHPSFYDVSVPWRIAKTSATSLTLEVPRLPRCAAVSGAAGPGWPDTTVLVGAEVAMVSGSCRTDATASITVGRLRDGSSPKHGPTGPSVGMLTGFEPRQFTYFDGRTRTVA